jgi:hypothetical protein
LLLKELVLKEMVAVVTPGNGDQGVAQGIGDKGCYSRNCSRVTT